MLKQKVLLLGSSGMAGQVLKIDLEKKIDLVELTDISRSQKISKPKIKLDVTNFRKLEEIILNNNYNYIINVVGILNQDAEKNPSKAILINSYLPHFLANITKEMTTKVIHISTDCVFSGKKGDYSEFDFKDGIGYYAQSKAIGEIINKKDLTIRTSIIGPDKKPNGIGLFNWVLNQKGNIKGFINAYWSGVTTTYLSKYIISGIVESNLPCGLINLSNNKKINKYNLVNIIKDVFNIENLEISKCDKYKVDKSLINSSDEISLNIPSYLEMIMDMKNWMDKNNY